jgi:hypothetical protein
MHYYDLGTGHRVRRMSRKLVVGFGLGLISLVVLLIIAAQFVSIFVIQPIGALPEGQTVVITRLSKLQFVDSPDAVCSRLTNGVTLLCRGMVAARVAEESTILLRLPYSEWLYKISTGGETYDR